MNKVINNRKVHELVLLIILLIVIVLTSLYKKRNKEQLKSDYKVSVGSIVKFYPRGSDVPRRINYCYIAMDSTYYYRTIDVSYKFEICLNFENCRDKRYWVIYSPDNPENSLINLEIEIQGIKNPEFPEDLDDFK
jgi:hypothetical protein